MSNQASTVPTNPTCPDCGTPLASGALAGICPACLLKSGASADSVTQAGRIPFIPPTVEELAALFPALEILEFIGKGGMGAVYKARQRQLDRIVALKVLPPALGDDATFAERFAREARALAKLNHPGIVTLYEFGHVTQPTGPLFYILMEFVDGVNLRQLLSGGRISPREALAIVPQICDALQFAHDRGIVHRDIKPENLLIDRRGAVKVADFGLAKLVGNDGRAGSPLPAADSPVESGAQETSRPTNDLTDAGKVMGTPRYMAPEQSERPSEVDHRADIYALGVVFYQMLTGELPAKELRPPSTKVQIDVRLDEIVLRALERNPSQRYAAVSEMKTEVEMLEKEPLEASSKDSGSTRTMENPAAEAKPDQTRFHTSTAIRVFGITMGAAIFLWLFLPKNDGSRGQQTNVAVAAPQTSSKKTFTVPDFQIRRVLTDLDLDLPADLLPEPRYQQVLKVERTPLLDGSAIAGAFVEESRGKTNPPNIRVKLTVDGSRKFQEITRTNLNRRLAIMVNGKILSAPNITEEIKGGGFQIPGPRVEEEMDALLKHLNSGSSEFSNLRFGKTNSLTITNSPRNQPVFLSLEWGLWVTNPPAPTHTRRFQDWRRSNNVDLAGRYIEPGSSGANIPMVLTFSLTLADIGKDSWDRITPEMARLHWNLPDELAESMNAIMATGSAGTYLFRTERDVFGVIEVLGATPDDSGVRIRYKLVEHGSQP